MSTVKENKKERLQHMWRWPTYKRYIIILLLLLLLSFGLILIVYKQLGTDYKTV